MTETEEHITTLFCKNPESWSKNDLARVVARFREMKAQGLFGKVDPKTGEPKQKKPRKRKVDPRQFDLEDLIVKEKLK
jgi:hypothetical protein